MNRRSEVFDIDNMYTQFLEGVMSISGGELVITDILEENDFAQGGSKQSISFNLNGRPYQFKTVADDDWFNTKMIEFMNRTLAAEGYDKRLWACSDGYQACILFYNTKEWAGEYEKLMGYALWGKGDSGLDEPSLY